MRGSFGDFRNYYLAFRVQFGESSEASHYSDIEISGWSIRKPIRALYLRLIEIWDLQSVARLRCPAHQG